MKIGPRLPKSSRLPIFPRIPKCYRISSGTEIPKTARNATEKPVIWMKFLGIWVYSSPELSLGTAAGSAVVVIAAASASRLSSSISGSAVSTAGVLVAVVGIFAE